MTAIALRSGPLTLRLKPDWGGRVTALQDARGADWLVPIDETAAFDPWAWPKGGAYPLIPFHGRVACATFPWGGRDITLPVHPRSAPHALHGHAHRYPWTVQSTGPDHATLELAHRSNNDWPFAFHATQRFTLSPDTLKLTLSIRNSGTDAMPWDLGWHPYFPKAPSFQTDASGYWPEGDVPGVPSGKLLSEPAKDYAGRTTLAEGATRFSLLGDRPLEMTFTPPARHLVIHDDPPEYICAEPACAPPNALNIGCVPILQPGETASITIRLTSL